MSAVTDLRAFVREHITSQGGHPLGEGPKVLTLPHDKVWNLIQLLERVAWREYELYDALSKCCAGYTGMKGAEAMRHALALLDAPGGLPDILTNKGKDHPT